MPNTLSLRPLRTTLIGGVVFLLPLIVTLMVIGQGLALAAKVIEPIAHLLPFDSIGGVTAARLAALLLLLALCFGAGLLARAAVVRKLSSSFEARLLMIYPRYAVFRAMSQGLRGNVGQAMLEPVLASFDDHQLVAYQVETLDDGRRVLFLPGAPDVWSGSVVLVPAERVAPLQASPAVLAKCLQGLGHGLAAQLRTPTPTPPLHAPTAS